jgi:hypothetical protein
MSAKKTKKMPARKRKTAVAGAPLPGRVLLLRTCTADMRGTNEQSRGFAWPKSGHVAAPDWNPAPKCGGGLHGLLWGEGRADLLLWDDAAVWLVIEADADKVVEITENGGGKCKVPECDVVCCGTRFEATSYMVNRAPGKRVHGALITAGSYGTATAGSYGTATAGYSGTVQVKWWDEKANRYRIATGYVGEDGIEKGVKYKAVDGKLVKADK